MFALHGGVDVGHFFMLVQVDQDDQIPIVSRSTTCKKIGIKNEAPGFFLKMGGCVKIISEVGFSEAAKN